MQLDSHSIKLNQKLRLIILFFFKLNYILNLKKKGDLLKSVGPTVGSGSNGAGLCR